MTDPGSDDGSLRFAWYGRLSTDELQQPQLAFPSQRAACERRVRGIGRIVCEFTDVESGRSDDRAGIEALFAEAGRADRRFDAVVTYKAERFARRMVLALAYEEELRLANISIYVLEGLDGMERSLADVREWLAFREGRERPPLWTPRSLS
jgi:DNA invertase Pin-like site-specific DNA recombinase